MKRIQRFIGIIVVSASTCLASCGDIGPTQIWFFSYRNFQYDIYRMNANGTEVFQLTDSEGASADPAVRRDGSKIVFSQQFFTDGDGGNVDIVIMNPNGSNQIRLTTGSGDDRHPSFTPDGNRIVWETGGNIWIMNADGSSKTQLTFGGADREPSVSPNGQQVMFTRLISGVRKVHVMSINGSNVTQVLFGSGQQFWPRWSPSGEMIVYSQRDANNNERLRLCNADGSGDSELTSGFRDKQAVFSGDGTQIFFTREPPIMDGGNVGKIYRINIDGSGLTLISAGAEDDGGPALRGRP